MYLAVYLQLETRSALLLQAGMEAASSLMRLCAADACPQHLLNETALETVCSFLAEVTNANLLAFFNPTVRMEARPDLKEVPLRVRCEPWIALAEPSASFLHRIETLSTNCVKLTGVFCCEMGIRSHVAISYPALGIHHFQLQQ